VFSFCVIGPTCVLKNVNSLHKKNSYAILAPNVAVEWLRLLLCIREVPGSNLSPEVGYPD
jgi:hypothetical protein